MHLEGFFETTASSTLVWRFLLDPKAMAPCLPDLQSLDMIDTETFKAKVKVGVRGVTGIVNFDFRYAEKVPTSSAKLVGSGKGLGSTVDIQAKFSVTDSCGHGTGVTWIADVTIAGLIAGLGEKTFESTSTKWVTQFAENLRNRLDFAK